MEWSSINCWLRALRNLTNFDQQLSPLRNVRQIGTKPSGSQVHWSLFSNLCFYPHENSFRLSFYTLTLSYVGTLRAFGLEVFTQVFLFFCCFFSTVVPWSSSSRWEEVQLDIIMETSWLKYSYQYILFSIFYFHVSDSCAMIQLVKMGGSAAQHHYGDFAT